MRKVLLSLFVLVCSFADGEDIAAVYGAALENDPVLKAAIAQRKIRHLATAQARATLLPNIRFSASKGESLLERGRQPVTDPLMGEIVRDENAEIIYSQLPDIESERTNWSVQVNQSVFNLRNWFSYQSALAQRTQADWDFAATEQAFYMRVVTAYLGVLRAQDQLEAVLAAEQAVKRQLEQVQQRFNVGLVAITDVLEATAAYDDSVVNQISALGSHGIFFETLSTITGKRHDELARLSDELPIVDPTPNDESHWVNVAMENSPLIYSAKLSLRSAKNNHRRALSSYSPTLNWSWSHSFSENTGISLLGRESKNTEVSFSLNVPIFQGGGMITDLRSSALSVEQSKQNIIERKLVVARDVRNNFRLVQTDVVRVRQRQKALESSKSALEATETGYEVGTRNIVDVLNAQQKLFSALFNYAGARYDYILNLMRLKQSTGTLTEDDLFALNQYTDPGSPVKKITSLSGT